MLDEGWVYEVRPPHRRVPVPERPCVECGLAGVARRMYIRQCCRACYMRRYRREMAHRQGRPHFRYYRRGVGCAVCGLVPQRPRHGYGLMRGLCAAHYVAGWRREGHVWRAQRREGAA